MILRAADIRDQIPAETIHRYRIIPLSMEEGVLRIGVAQVPSGSVLRDLAFLTGKRILPVEVDPAEVDAYLQEHASGERLPGHSGDGALGQSEPAPPVSRLDAGKGETPDIRAIIGQGSVVQQVNAIIHQAIELGASDIHVEPYEHLFRLRYRLDGVLHQVAELSLLQKEALLSRLKIMAALDIAEKRRPQDGRIRIEHHARTIDLRVSTLPTDFGEKVVLRILDRSHLDLDLEKLGFEQENLDLFRRAIRQPYGMILITGPTGSGKTTTLYAALSALNAEAVNITTIEDPIEYNLPGVNQTHVRADIGLTFAQALRAFLRQDPDVIMVGEIRDAETAEIGIRAALTGHLVLSTLHTNDAPSTISRLLDMGVEPFLVASSVRLVVAQRLVRRVCAHCREEARPDPTVLKELHLREAPARFVRGRGCAPCNYTGYRGRTALFEVMPVSEALAELVARRASTAELLLPGRTRDSTIQTWIDRASRSGRDLLKSWLHSFRVDAPDSGLLPTPFQPLQDARVELQRVRFPRGDCLAEIRMRRVQHVVESFR